MFVGLAVSVCLSSYLTESFCVCACVCVSERAHARVCALACVCGRVSLSVCLSFAHSEQQCGSC